MFHPFIFGLRSALAVLSLTVLFSFAASMSASADDFYRGKQIRLLVGTDVGGAYDTYARALARHMGKHIPGEPTFVVQNMPAVAGLKLTNYIFSGAPSDGTVFAGVPNAIPTATLTNPKEAQFDPNKLAWIGSATKELYVGYVWHMSPVQSMEDAKTKEVIMGGIAVGSFSTDVGILAADYFGLKIRTITGYKSSPEVQLAVEKGEVHGVMGTAYSALRIGRAGWLADKKIKVIVQYGFKRHPLYPDVPLYMDFAKTDAQRQALVFELGNLVHGKPYFAPPDIPADRLVILRRAFDATMKDPEFLADITKQGGEIDSPMTGEELAQFVGEESRTPPAVLESIHKVLEKFSQTR